MRCPYEVVITSDSSAESYSAAAWDPCTGSQLNTYRHASAVGHHSLQLLHNSYLIASNAAKPALHLWPLNSQTPVPNLRLSTPGRVTALACMANGSFIAAALSEKIYIWQTCNGQLLNSFTRHYQTITCLLFNKDGSYLASGAEDGLIFVYSFSQIVNEKEVKPICSFSHHSLPIKDLYFGQLGNFGRLCSVSLDRSARIYDVNSNELLLTLIFDVPLTTVCMDKIENNLFVGTSTGLVIKSNLREPPRGIEHHVALNGNKNDVYKGHEGSITSLAVSVDCITLLTGSSDGNVHLWDIPSYQIILTIKHKAPIVSAFFAPAYENFKVNTLKPSLPIRPLQKVSDQGDKPVFLEVYRNDEDDSWLLDFDTPTESFSPSNKDDSEADDCKAKLKEALEEIKRLKKVNADLYQFGVKNIIDTESDESEK